MERALLRDALQHGTRRSCRAKITGDCTISLQNQGKLQIASGMQGSTSAFHPPHRKFGVAVDIGTTTLAAQLYQNERL